MPIELPNQITCGICGYPMELHKGDMAYRCTVCPAETWIEEEKMREFIRINKLRETADQIREQNKWRIGTNLNTEVLPIYPFPSGKSSGNKSGRKRKKPGKVRKEYYACI